ncbi:MAG TPA: substrate-binding domain-containing protein [Candidatus Aquilonibacter sp.]|nr:substrate-binding domain-containing protein [Candidatus Aquilonibacter sp.]
MKKNSVNTLMSCAVVILAVVTALWLATPPDQVQAAGDPIVVIVNSSNPVSNLTISDLKKLFLSDRSRWDTGKAVAPVMVGPGAPERSAFLKVVCGMNDAEFSKYFLQAAFTGSSATPPKVVGNAQDVKSVVAGSPGAIGFVKAQDFHGDGSDGGVKSVKVDGAAAADPGYKLRM